MRTETKYKTIIGRFNEINPDLTSRYCYARRLARGKVVLDIGCAAGYGSHYLATEGRAKSMVGVDISKKAITLARKFHRASNLRYQVANAQKLPFEDVSFDLVISFEVIEHVHDYQQHLHEILRVLKKGGLAIISTPNKHISSPDTKLPIIPCHVKEFYPEELKTILEQRFSKVALEGQVITTKKYLDENTRYRNSFRFKLTKRLSQIRLVRQVALYSPTALTNLVSGGKEGSPHLSPKSIKYVDDLTNARSIIALCEK